jgi:hypothetical protein
MKRLAVLAIIPVLILVFVLTPAARWRELGRNAAKSDMPGVRAIMWLVK